MKNNDIKIREIKLSQLFNKLNNAKIPYFQREYTWTWNQVEELMDDIKTSKSNNYYTGSIVIQSKNDEQWILDGQQRISTFILIVNELSKLYRTNENEIVDELRIQLKNLDFQSANIKDGIVLKKIIESTYESDINEKFKDTIYYKHSISIHNYLTSLKNNEEDYTEIFINNLYNVIFAYISIDSHLVDSNVLFEKINSTGIKLSAFDLVKNYLLSKIYEEIYDGRKIEEYATELHEFTSFLDIKPKSIKIKEKDQLESIKLKEELIRSFIAFETKEKVNHEHIYQKFKELYNSENSGNKSAQNIFQRLKKYAIYYEYLFKKYWSLNKKINKPMMVIYEQFGTFDTLIIHILMLNSNFENGEIIFNDDQIEEIYKTLLIIEAYIFRRTYTGYSQKVITRKIPALKLNLNKKLTYRQSLYNELFIKPNNGDERELYKMPTYSEFCHSIKNDWNMYQTRKITTIFLFRLGTYKSKENFDISNFSIEHVLPQNHEQWIIREQDIELIEQKKNVLGNLSLTAYNSEYSNYPFNIKKDKMIESDNFPMNDYFLRIKEWNVDEIDIRTKELLSICNQIWNFDELDNFFEKFKDKKILDSYYQPDLSKYEKYDFKKDDLFKTAIINRSHFAKVPKEKFTYDVVKQIIEHYVCDGISYPEIEKQFFGVDANGWIGQSIIEALNIDKNDKNKITQNKLKNYIHSREENILKLLQFMEYVESVYY